MTGGVVATYAFRNTISTSFTESFTVIFRGLHDLESIEALVLVSTSFALAVLPSICGAIAGFILGAAVQLGAPPAFKTPGFDLSKLASPQALMNVLSPKAIFGRGLISTAKMLFVALAATYALMAEHAEFNAHPALDAHALAVRLVAATIRVFSYAGGALVLIAAVELIKAKRDLMARMRMTPEEMKREMREQDGDPHIKRKRKQRMREIARKRLAHAVKGADVVIVNPTEYAVALRYASKTDRAPRVVAKGRGVLAERIRELARNNGIPILAQPPLARLLYRVVREGREIPADTFQAVAQVLAYVQKLKRRRS
jgi:flagellar biosynthesis protein FlhB